MSWLSELFGGGGASGGDHQNTTGSFDHTTGGSGQTTNTPNVPSWLQQPFQNYMQQLGAWGANAPAGPNGLMQQAWFGAGNLGPTGNFNAQRGINATNGLLLGFNPQTVTPQNAATQNAQWQNAATQNAATQNAQTNLGQNTLANAALGHTALTGQGQTLGNTNYQRYVNHYVNNVIDRSMADLERARQGAINNGQAEATQAGAYGGSRHGVADSLTNREFADSAGNLSANLRADAFNNAQGAAQFDVGNDLNRRMTNTGALNQMRAFNANNLNNTRQFNAANQNALSMFNANAGNDINKFNANWGNQNNQFNAAAGNDINRFNAAGANQNSQFNAAAGNDMNRFNVGNNLQGQMFNSNQGLAGARFRGDLANQIANLGFGQEANARNNILTQLGVGQQQWGMSPQNLQAQQLQQLQGLLGMNPSDFFGSTRNINSLEHSEGTDTGTSQSGHDAGLFDILGFGANLLNLFSDRRLKKDIAYLDDDARGNRWYEFRYVWDENDAPLRVGVMADEAPAHAVSRHPSGYLMVDYGAL